MLNQLLNILRSSGADAWEVTDQKERGWEFYFIRHRLDQNRCKEVESFQVKVYRSLENGKYLGSAGASVAPDASEEEMRRIVEGLCQDAQYVRNPAYTLHKPANLPPEKESPVDLKTVSGDFLKAMRSLPETATEDLNSYEIFVSEIRRRFLSSEGIDVTAVYPSSMVEAVVNARKDGHEIELYRLYTCGTCDPAQLARDLSETLRLGRDKLTAGNTPAVGKADVVFSTDASREIYNWFIDRMSASMVYRGISDWKIGQPIAKEFRGDRITVRALRFLPNSSGNAGFDSEGAPVRDLTILDAGIPAHYYGSRQFSQYLGIEDSFIPGNFEATGGTASLKELRSGRFLEVVEFSDFQVDPLNGDLAGEIRLAYWHDGTGSVQPVSGGSISGTLSDLVSTLRCSRESRQYDTLRIPSVTRLQNVTVTGI